jgi:hypothetical protein
MTKPAHRLRLFPSYGAGTRAATSWTPQCSCGWVGVAHDSNARAWDEADKHEQLVKTTNEAIGMGYVPYTVVDKMDPAGGPTTEVELMSYPFVEDEKVWIMARTVVDDPTTLVKLDVMTLGDVIRRT